MELFIDYLSIILLYTLGVLSFYIAKRCWYYMNDILRNDNIFKKILFFLMAFGCVIIDVVDFIMFFNINFTYKYLI